MEDWEDEQVSTIVGKEQPVFKWDDEDVDENDVKESWEDEEEPAPAPAPETNAEKAPKNHGVKPKGKKDKTIQETLENQEEVVDPVAEKLRQQRLVEEADFASTSELFGKKGDDHKSLNNFIPKSENDFLEYAELISYKLRPFEKSFHYMSLLKMVMRLSMTNLKAADAKDISSSVTAIANEKLKAEKEANVGKKKTGGKKKQLHREKSDDDIVVNTYDEADDFDFM